MKFKNLSFIVLLLGLFIASSISVSTIWAHPDAVYSYEDQNFEIEFIGIAIEYHKGTGIGAASYWTIEVDEVISGSQPESDQVDVVTSQSTPPPWGYVDPDIEEGDRVEVHGRYLQWSVNPEKDSITLNGSEEYYVKISLYSGTSFGYNCITVSLTITAIVGLVILAYFIFQYRKSRSLSPSTIAP